MKKVIRKFSLVLISLVVLWGIVPLTMVNAGEGLRYSCSAQIYEALTDARLEHLQRKQASPLTCLLHPPRPASIGCCKI